MNQRKQRRIEEAAVRQAEYSALSTVEKIARVAARRGASKREMAKLFTQLRAEQEAA